MKKVFILLFFTIAIVSFVKFNGPEKESPQELVKMKKEFHKRATQQATQNSNKFSPIVEKKKLEQSESHKSSDTNISAHQQYVKRYQLLEGFLASSDQNQQIPLVDFLETVGKQDINFLTSTLQKIFAKKKEKQFVKAIEYIKQHYQANKKFILNDSIKNLADDGSGTIANAKQESVFYSHELKELQRELKKHLLI